MLKVSNVETWGFEHAIRGMRNPLNSWDKSDSSCFIFEKEPPKEYIKKIGYTGFFSVVGKNDLELMQKLYKAGSEHRKYLRQIFVSMDITAPLYWWKEFDTYKVGTVANSCSTMHKIHAKEFTLDDFSHEHLDTTVHLDRNLCSPDYMLRQVIYFLNNIRELYLQTKNKQYWWQMIQLLPASYNQRRTITMNYENVMNMINQRRNHKLDEWRNFVELELLKLPYIKEIRGEE